MIYLLLGEDEAVKEANLTQLKEKFLTSTNARHFDFEILYAHKIDPLALQKALLALPVSGSRRMVLVRESHHLSTANKEFLRQFSSLKHDHVVLILESTELNAQDSFVKVLKPAVKLLESAIKQKLNVFDMTRAIGAHRSAEAIKILSTLFADGVHPLQIMGGLVWFWGKLRPQLAPDKFEEGLYLLQEADVNIKRSRLQPEHAVELVVIKLANLFS